MNKDIKCKFCKDTGTAEILSEENHNHGYDVACPACVGYVATNKKLCNKDGVYVKEIEQ